MLLLLVGAPVATALRQPLMSRRALGATAAAVVLHPASALALTAEELDKLDLESRVAAGVTLPSGVRVIDVLEGEGPLPKPGDRVYIHFKVWTKGFRVQPVADSSFAQASVYEWKLGEPTDRIPKGAAEAALGMREGGWRRMVIPAAQAYGDEGLLMPTRGGKLSSKAVYAVEPGTDVYFDVRVVDGGSGKCEALLHPPGMPDVQAKRLGSLTCVRGAP